MTKPSGHDATNEDEKWISALKPYWGGGIVPFWKLADGTIDAAKTVNWMMKARGQKPSEHDAASLPQPREVCPTCGSNKRDLRVRQECKYMCSPVNWKWVRDEYGRCTDFIECCNPWHELVAASLPVDQGAPDERENADRRDAAEQEQNKAGCGISGAAPTSPSLRNERSAELSMDRGAAQPDLEDIGNVRRSLFLRVDHPWNGIVRDVTAQLEIDGMVNREAVLRELTRHIRSLALMQSLAQPDLEAIALKYFPHVQQKQGRTRCLAAMREALQLPSREVVRELERERDEFKEAAYRLENTIRLLRAERLNLMALPLDEARIQMIANVLHIWKVGEPNGL